MVVLCLRTYAFAEYPSVGHAFLLVSTIKYLYLYAHWCVFISKMSSDLIVFFFSATSSRMHLD